MPESGPVETVVEPSTSAARMGRSPPEGREPGSVSPLRQSAGSQPMNKTACVSSLIVLFAVSPALIGQPPGGNPGSARSRNERQAERTNPAERAALLAVTNAGANVIVNDAGSVEVVDLEGCAFPDSLLEALRDLPRLKQLKIGHTRVTDSSLQYVRPLTTL